jgi:hypothetical protein
MTPVMTRLPMIVAILFCGLLQSRGDETNRYREQPVHMRTTAPYHNLVECVALFERRAGTNGFQPHGSGFYVTYEGFIFAVTAQHVIQRAGKPGEWLEPYTNLFLRIRPKDTKSKAGPERKPLQVPPCFHTNNNVDLAILPVEDVPGLDEVVSGDWVHI